MSRPFLLVQLSDFHIGADWTDSDPAARLAAVVDAIRTSPEQPDAVLVSGDLAENAVDAEYEQARELVALLEAPLYVLPGNHDDRDTLRRHFEVPGTGAEPIRYTVDLGPLRLVTLDTTRPGEDAGALDGEQLHWLDAELAAAPELPTLVAMHHPPIVTGMPSCDEVGLPAAHRYALGEVIRRHRQVRRIVAGHVHRLIVADLAGRPVLTVPSTYVQTQLAFGSSQIEFSDEPASFAWHAMIDGQLISHIRSVE